MDVKTELMKVDAGVEIKTMKCDKCDFETIHKKYLEDHRRSHINEGTNSENIKLECDDYDFITRKRHKINPTKTFSCDLCKYKTLRKGCLKEHQLTHLDEPSKMEKKLMCDQCDFSCLRKGSLRIHHKRKHSGDWKPRCIICSEKFTSINERKKHLEIVHDIVRGTTQRLYTPEFKIDAVKRVNQIGFRKTVEDLHIYPVELKKWINLIFKPLICSFCGKSFAYEWRLKTHEKVHKQTNSETSLVTNKIRPRKRVINERIHSESVHEQTKKKRKEISKKAYQCEKCPKSLSNPYKLKYHMQTCTGSINNLGSKVDPHFIQTVIKLAKETTVLNSCKVYNLENSTVRNWVKKHDPDKNYQCDICEKIFAYQSILKDHMKSHNDMMYEKPRPGVLIKLNGTKPTYTQGFREEAVKLAREESIEESCRRNGISKSILSDWIKLIENPILCEICSKAFSKKSRYRAHMQIHFPENKDILEEETDVANHLREMYLQKYSLEEEKSGKDVMEENIVKGPGVHIKNNETKPTYSQSFREEAVKLAREESLEESCISNGISKSLMLDWIKLIENPILCEICSKGFTRKSRYKEHMLVHFPENRNIQDEENNLANRQTADLREMYLQKYSVDGEEFDDNVMEKITGQVEMASSYHEETEGDIKHFESLEEKTKTQEGNVTKEMDVDAMLKDLTNFAPELNNSNQTNVDAVLSQNIHDVLERPTSESNEIVQQNKEIDYEMKTEEDNFINVKVEGGSDDDSIKLETKLEEIKEEHEKVVLEKEYMCDICNKKCSSKQTYTIHSRLHTGERPFTCSVCGKGFIDNNSLKKHTLNKHTVNGNTEVNFTCNLCGLEVTTSKDSGESFKCDICLQKFKLECEVCGKRFTKSNHKKEHVRMVHDKERNFECEFCQKKFSTKQTYTIHIRLHTGDKPFACQVCGKGFIDKNSLRKHTMNTHTEKEKFSCEQCGSEFARSDGLSKHVLNVHDSGESFKCELCSRKFRSEDAFLNHRENHINGDLTCTICGKEFDMQARLSYHMKIHLGIKESQCIDCGKQFASERNLKQHVNRIHLNIKETYSCNICDRNFDSKQSLAGHMKSHSETKAKNNIQCGDCGKMYSSERNLKQHVEIIHLGKRDFDCQHCGKSFTRLSALKVHMLTHSNETPFQCEFCDQGYKEKRNLVNHIEKQHTNQ